MVLERSSDCPPPRISASSCSEALGSFEIVPRDWLPPILEIKERLERDYQQRFLQVDSAMTVGGTPTELRVEVATGEGGSGPMWGTAVKYARRRGWFGPIEPTVGLESAERQLRKEIDNWLSAREQDRDHD